jgi:hypothetical protein
LFLAPQHAQKLTGPYFNLCLAIALAILSILKPIIIANTNNFTVWALHTPRGPLRSIDHWNSIVK